MRRGPNWGDGRGTWLQVVEQRCRCGTRADGTGQRGYDGRGGRSEGGADATGPRRGAAHQVPQLSRRP